MKHALITALIAVLIPASLHAGEIYRWTDESGNTHYSENPPQGVDAEPMNVQTRSSEARNTNGAPKEERSSPQQSDGADNSGQSDKALSDQEQQDQEAIDRVRQRNCEKARKALKTLAQNARIQVEEDGERRYLSPEEKEAERKRYDEARDENCD